MVKSGLIVGAIALLISAGSALLSPLCFPCCLGIFLGLGAGFLAGVFDKPLENNAATKAGALSGVIGGAGALLGQVIGAVINGVLVGPEGTARLMEQLGLPYSYGIEGQVGYWSGLFISGCCLGLLDIALMAGLGALGGILWWQTTGKKAAGVVMS